MQGKALFLAFYLTCYSAFVSPFLYIGNNQELYFTENVNFGSLSAPTDVFVTGNITASTYFASNIAVNFSVYAETFNASSRISSPSLTCNNLNSQIISTSSLNSNTVSVTSGLSANTVTASNSVSAPSMSASTSVSTPLILTQTGNVGIVTQSMRVGSSGLMDYGLYGSFHFLQSFDATTGTGSDYYNHWFGFLPAAQSPYGYDIIHMAGVTDPDNIRRIGLWDDAYINQNGYIYGSLTVSGTITSGSDKRIKRDIKPIDSDKVLESLLKLEVKEYRYKPEWDRRQSGILQHGFIAQEVQEIFPDAVQPMERKFEVDGKNETMLGLNYYRLYVDTVAAFQAFHRQVTSELQTLKQEVEELKKMLRK